jgi:hypothetical protein
MVCAAPSAGSERDRLTQSAREKEASKATTHREPGAMTSGRVLRVVPQSGFEIVQSVTQGDDASARAFIDMGFGNKQDFQQEYMQFAGMRRPGRTRGEASWLHSVFVLQANRLADGKDDVLPLVM